MEKSTKELIENFAVVVGGSTIVCGTFLGTYVIKHKIDKKRKEEFLKNEREREEKCKEYNKEINNYLLNAARYPVKVLINDILSNDHVSSFLKNKAIEHIKCGRNTLSDDDTKSIYHIITNGLLSESDRSAMIHNICDGHVKTNEELEAETKEKVARYEYLKTVEAENTKREQARYNYYAQEKEHEKAIKQTKIIAETTRDVLTQNKNSEEESKN